MKKPGKALRITVGAALPLVIAALIFVFIRFGSPPCFFHKATGLYCPGCGAGRALKALLEFKITDALQYNLFFVLSLPLAAVFLVKFYVWFVFDKEIMKKLKITDKGAVIYASLLGAFFILRNVPAPPFWYLNPDVFL